MVKNNRPEGVDEVWARRVVAEVLDHAVSRHDVGGQSQVDALIELGDGRIGALEMIGDYDSASMQLYSALGGVEKDLNLENLRHSWLVHLEPAARVKKIEPSLQSALSFLEQQGISKLDIPHTDGFKLTDEQARFKVLAISYVVQIDGDPGAVRLRSAAWGGTAKIEDLDPGRWVDEVLNRQQDVVPKLLNHPDAVERHAFIWASPRSDLGVRLALSESGDTEGYSDPTVPLEITHVWVGAMSSSGGVLLWTIAQGWTKTSWAWPASRKEFEATEAADEELRAARAASQ